jgi:hypothetical protein
MLRNRRSLALTTVTALVALAASAPSASAIEAPYFKINATRLGAGESSELLVASSGNQILNATTYKIFITCTTVKTKTGATLNGSGVGDPGTSTTVLEYSECSVEGNGAGCQLPGNKFTTSELKGELAYSTKEPKKGTLLVNLFSPVTGSEIALLTFAAGPGHSCTINELLVQGSLLFAVQNSKGENVAVEEHEGEEEILRLHAIAGEACKVKAAAFTECKKSSIKLSGTTGKLESTTNFKLASKAPFGIFSK